MSEALAAITLAVLVAAWLAYEFLPRRCTTCGATFAVFRYSKCRRHRVTS